jgi:hypothetical protein
MPDFVFGASRFSDFRKRETRNFPYSGETAPDFALP